jgi:hypothetical protein
VRKISSINVVSRNCDIWNNWGQALCTMSGFYLTAGERLSREGAHRKLQHMPKMSMEDEVDFLNQEYMLPESGVYAVQDGTQKGFSNHYDVTAGTNSLTLAFEM